MEHDIEKNNELFSNALAYNLMGSKKFKKILYKQGKSDIFINEYCWVIEKHITDFQEKLLKL